LKGHHVSGPRRKDIACTRVPASVKSRKKKLKNGWGEEETMTNQELEEFLSEKSGVGKGGNTSFLEDGEP